MACPPGYAVLGAGECLDQRSGFKTMDPDFQAHDPAPAGTGAKDWYEGQKKTTD